MIRNKCFCENLSISFNYTFIDNKTYNNRAILNKILFDR